jgi:hypothetical protein
MTRKPSKVIKGLQRASKGFRGLQRISKDIEGVWRVFEDLRRVRGLGRNRKWYTMDEVQ